MPKPDIQKLLAAEIKRTVQLVNAQAETIRLLEKALELSKAGKPELARAAEKQAMKWKAKLDKIEGMSPTRSSPSRWRRRYGS